MLTFKEAVQRFLDLQAPSGIPDNARLAFVEKRQIELSPKGEIEELPNAPAPSYSEEDEPESGSYHSFIESLVWVGEFTFRSSFWELAIDSNGQLVRFRKSR